MKLPLLASNRYLYHITTIDRLESISSLGLIPNMKNNMARDYSRIKGTKPLWLTPYPSYCMMKMGVRGKAVLLKVDVTELEVERYVLFNKSTPFEFLIYNRIPPKNISVLKKFEGEALFRKVKRY